MALRFRYSVDCECGGRLSATSMDLDQGPGQFYIDIDLDMIGDMVLECDYCVSQVFVPSLSDMIMDMDD